MKNRTNITYTFLLLAIGIVSTILSNPILAQTEGNSQNQTGGQGQQQGGQGQQQGGGSGADSGGQMKAGDDIGSIEELQSLSREGPPTSTKNDTTGLFQDLGKETSTDQGFAGDKEQQGGQGQQQGNQTGGQGQQQGNQTGGQGQQQGGQGQQQGGQQEGNQTAGTSGGQQQGGQGQQQGGQQEGNQTGNPLTDIGEQIGNLFK
jgi:hypothetical protein